MATIGFTDLLTEWLAEPPMSPELIAGYGRDLWCEADVRESAEETEGLLVVAQCIYRRLSTDRGSLLGCPDFGLDIRSFLQTGMDPLAILAIPALVDQEIRKEPGVLNCTVEVRNSTPTSLELSCLIEAIQENGEAGQFPLVVNVTQAGVEIAGLELT